VEGQLQRTVGRNIRRLRRERGLSQEELADEIGVHRTFMGGVERGERNLTLQTLERLAERLGVDPVSLLEEPDRA
jgi:transcriptional regulator with XRE-family HTH domain